MNETLILILGFVASIYIAWNLGANDAANPTETAVGAGVISIKKAIILFSTFATLGALVQGYMVMKTIGKGVVSSIDPIGALIAALSAGVWITLVTWKGLPVSTTHSSVGAVLGIGLAYLFFEGVNNIRYSVVYKVIASWLISPIMAILVSMSLYHAFFNLYFKLKDRSKDPEKIFKYILIGNLIFSAYAFGANDVGNATGVFMTATSSILGTPDTKTMFLLALIGSAGITLGAFTWGHKVIETVGFKITRLDPISGAAAGLSNALVVWGFSTIPSVIFGYGMPISTTHASVSSVIGVGIAKERSIRALNLRVIGYILASWILTVPVAAGLSFALYLLVRLII